MRQNTIETTTSGKGISFTFRADAELLAHIEQHRERIHEQSGVRVSLSQATAGLLRRGLEAMAAS